MKWIVAFSVFAALAITTVGVGTAHPAGYISGVGCVGALFTNGLPVVGGQACVAITNCANDVLGTGHSIGAARFCGNHLQADDEGRVTLDIFDDILNPVAAVYCQDLNSNSICGERDPFAPPGLFLEPRVHVCFNIVLEAPIAPGSKTQAQWAAGNNWDTTQDVFVFLDGIAGGTPLAGTLPSNPLNLGPIPPAPGSGGPCGGILYDGGTIGIVTHS